VVWRPRDYGEVQTAIGVVAEDSQLDFKSAYSKPDETAKDIAAMTVEGGVVAYGIDEQGGVAVALPNVVLAGAKERIQQIVDTRIRPVPTVEIDVFPATSGGLEGVVLVTVLPSQLAPHYANERYPSRSGATTRYLTEPEVESLYRQRQRLIERPAQGKLRLKGFIPAEGGFDAPADGDLGFSGFSSVGGVGVMRLLIASVADVRHPLGARVGDALTEAFREAQGTLSNHIVGTLAPRLARLGRWTPRGTLGWKAGHASTEYSDHAGGTVFAAATYSHSGAFSFQVSLALVDEPSSTRRAFEHLWLSELLAGLCCGATFLSRIPGVGYLQCELGLQGLENSISSSPDVPAYEQNPPRITDSFYRETGTFGARELARDPREAARLLLDRLLVSFLSPDFDLFSYIAPQR
jgi:hypothetical protein